MKRITFIILLLTVVFSISAQNLDQKIQEAKSKSLLGKTINYQIRENNINLNDIENVNKVDFSISSTSSLNSVDFKNKNGELNTNLDLNFGFNNKSTYHNYYKPILNMGVNIKSPQGNITDVNHLKNDLKYNPYISLSTNFDFNNSSEKQLLSLEKAHDKKKILESNVELDSRFDITFLNELKALINSKYELDMANYNYEKSVKDLKIDNTRNDYDKNSIVYKNKEHNLKQLEYNLNKLKQDYLFNKNLFKSEYGFDYETVILNDPFHINLGYKAYDDYNYELLRSEADLNKIGKNNVVLTTSLKASGNFDNNTLSKAVINNSMASIETGLSFNGFNLGSSVNLSHNNSSFSVSASYKNDNSKSYDIKKKKLEVERLKTQSLINKIKYNKERQDFEESIKQYNTNVDSYFFNLSIVSQQLKENKEALDKGLISQSDYENIIKKKNEIEKDRKILTLDGEILKRRGK